MRKRAFIPAVDGRLEPRVVMATAFTQAVQASILPPVTFGGGQVDPRIPLLRPFYGANNPNLLNPYQGIPIGFNYTSGNFNTLLTKGYSGTPGLLTLMQRYAASGNSAAFYVQLSSLAGHVPYGLQSDGLLYAWALGLYNTGRLPSGARLNGPAPTTPPGSPAAFTDAEVGQLIEASLIQFLRNGIGQNFNILKSPGKPHTTDKLLSFNGRV